MELPASSCHGVLHLRYYRLVGNFSRKPPGTLPGGVPEEEYYRALGYRGDVIGGYNSGWYHMSNRTPPHNRRPCNTHTHTPAPPQRETNQQQPARTLLPLLMVIPYHQLGGFHSLVAILTEAAKYEANHGNKKIIRP